MKTQRYRTNEALLPRLILITGIVFACLLLLRGIAAPWNGPGDTDGALFGTIARNYLQFGILELKFGQLATFEAINTPVGSYYLHHPPLFPLLSALSITLFGDSELSVRLVCPASITLASRRQLSWPVEARHEGFSLSVLS